MQAIVREMFGKEPHKGVNPDEVVAVVPAGDPGGRVGPDHVDGHAALFLFHRVGVLHELLFRLALLAAAAVEHQRGLEDGVLDESLGDFL